MRTFLIKDSDVLKHKPFLGFLLLLLLPVMLRAQNAEKAASLSPAVIDSAYYNPLWRNFDADFHFLRDANLILDEIESAAAEDHNSYQLFRAHYSRMRLNQEQWEQKKTILYLDSVRNDCRQYAADQSMATSYECLYHYLIAEKLWKAIPADYSSVSGSDKRLSQMDVWSVTDFREAAIRYFEVCLDSLPSLLSLATGDFAFMLNASVAFRNLRPTLFDLLLQDYIEQYYFLNQNRNISFLDSAIVRHHLPEDREIIIDYALMKLSFSRFDVTSCYDTCKYWKAIDSIEAAYGPDEAIDFTRGNALLHARTIENDTVGLKDLAVAYFDKVIAEGKNRYYVKNARCIREEIAHPRLKTNLASSGKCYAPAAKLRIPISYTNIDTVYVSVYTFKQDRGTNPWLDFLYDRNTKQNIIRSKEVNLLKECVQQQRYILKSPWRYNDYTSEIWLDSLPIGTYAILFHLHPQWDTSSVMASGIFSVSNIDVISISGDYSILAVNNRNTGEPLAHKKVVFNNFIVRYTDKNGEVRINPSLLSYYTDVKVRDGKDVFSTYLHKWGNRNSYYRGGRYHSYREDHSVIITDRMLYRPGQTLFFKSVYAPNGKTVKNRELCVVLSKKSGYHYGGIDTVFVKTSEMGSAAGSLKLPAEVGNYRIYLYDPNIKGVKRFSSPGVSVPITVSEYRLPSFSVVLEKDTAATAAGDTLFIRGKATSFTGVPVADASVRLNISFVTGSASVQVNLTSDNQGNFSYPYVTDKQDYFNMVNVTADVTDLNGETHSQTAYYTIDMKAFRLSVQYNPKQIDKAQTDTLNCLVMPRNTDRLMVSNPITLTLVRLKQPSEYLTYLFKDYPKPNVLQYSEEEYLKWFPHSTFDANADNPMSWPVLDTVLQLTRNCKEDSLVQMDVRKWLPGTYRISAFGVGSRNDTISFEDSFQVLDSRTDSIACQIPLLVEVTGLDKEYPVERKSDLAKIEDTVTVALSSCLPEATVMCRIFQDKHHIASCLLRTDGQQQHIPLTIKLKRGVNLCVIATAQKDNMFYSSESLKTLSVITPISKQKQKQLIETYPYLRLNLTHWNKMTEPGQSEEWELTVFHPDTAARRPAEVLAWMVDCSLYELDMHKFISEYKILPSFRKVRFIRQFGSGFKDFQLNHEEDCVSRNWYPTFHNPFEPMEKRYETLKGRALYRYSGGNDKVPVSWAAPVFDADNTTSVRLSGESVKATPGRRVNAALSNLDGVSSQDGEIKSVRGNRSDGAKVVVDGVRVRTEDLESDATGAGSEEQQEETTAPFVFSPQLKIRKSFQETAFFYPQLRTDEQGNVKFVFTVPDQYTKWHFCAVAHTADLKTGYLSEYVTSMKTLMLQTNAPRFFREGDTMLFQVKISNVRDSSVSGKAVLRFFDAVTNEPLPLLLQAGDSLRDFSCEGKQNTVLSWRMSIPADVTAVGYRVLAQAGHYGDGEENVVPVLPKRSLMTESIHFSIPSGTDTTVEFQSLIHNNSSTLQHYSYTVEVSSNPVWYAIRSLPYLMQYGYESNDQLFAKLYANAIARHLLTHNPSIAEVFEQWRKDTLNHPLQSALYKNEQLKNILLEETPWADAARQESEKNQELALLFEGHKLDFQIEKQYRKLSANQSADGGWCWYGSKGFNFYITTDIVAGYRKLQHLGIEVPVARQMMDKAIRRLDSAKSQAYQEYQKIKSENPKAVFNFSPVDVQYLYMRSMGSLDSNWLKQDYVQHLIQQSLKDVYESPLSQQAEMALFLYRIGCVQEAQQLIESLRQKAMVSRTEGMFWKQDPSLPVVPRYARKAKVGVSIECHARLMEAFAEISPRKKELDAMKQWLLAQKESNSWSNTKSTAEAIYALLLNTEEVQVSSSLNIENEKMLKTAEAKIQIGGREITAGPRNAEAGTGYRKYVWQQDSITPELGLVRVQTDSLHPVFGACYWQYFEDFDKANAASEGLSISRTLFHKESNESGFRLDSVTAEKPVHIGEKVTVRLVIRSERDLEYVHIKDLRASAFEPVDVREYDEFRNGLSYRVVPHDASTNFFISNLPKGTFIIDYELIATQSGQFSLGQTTIECIYNPVFRAQSRGERVEVKK